MTYTTLIKIAPITTLERVNDPNWARSGRTLYDHGSLTFFPGKTSVPLLVNHDENHEIGVVRELMRFEDTDGPWLVAVANVSDRPEWLKRGVRASFGFKLGRTSSFDRCDSAKGLCHRGVGLERGRRTCGASSRGDDVAPSREAEAGTDCHPSQPPPSRPMHHTGRRARGVPTPC